MITLNEKIQEALKLDKWVDARKNGKLQLDKIKQMQAGWVVILDDESSYGVVTRRPLSTGDYTILINGEYVKRNICQPDLVGFIQP